jgi:hypothetical protein
MGQNGSQLEDMVNSSNCKFSVEATTALATLVVEQLRYLSIYRHLNHYALANL